MKKLTLNHRLLSLLIISFGVIILLSACKKNNDDDDSIKRTSVQLTGAAEVPQVNTTGSGTGEVTFGQNARTIAYTIVWQLGSGSTATTGMHFHGADDGSPAKSSPIALHIEGFSAGTSGTLSGTTIALTQAQVDQLLAGKWYLNIHSDAYPAGEIRGNITFNGNSGSGGSGGFGDGGGRY